MSGATCNDYKGDHMQTIWKLFLAAGIALSVMGLDSWAADYPKMKLRYTNLAPQKMPNSNVDIFMAQELTRRTNGRVQVEIFHGRTLGKPKEILDLVSSGAVDIGNIAFGFFFSQMPMCTFFNTPMIYKDHIMAAKLSKLGYQTRKSVQQDMQRNNLHPLIFRALTQYRIISKKPIRTLSDFKGLKVRTFGAVNPIMFKALGAVPVTMVPHEAYEALKHGTIDAVFFPWAAAYAFKFHEVARYISNANFGAIVGYMTFINLDMWRSWPRELQELSRQIALEAEQLSIKIVGESDQKALDSMLAAGAQLVHFQEQEQLERALPDTIALVQQRVARVGAQYVEPAQKYADFLRAKLSK